MRETPVKILHQGKAKVAQTGYDVVGNEEAVCFYLDPIERSYIFASSHSEDGCPVIYISEGDHDGTFTEIEFPEFCGWRFHSGGDGKVLSIALRRDF